MNKQNRHHPHRILEALLRTLLPEREKHDLLGDYEEYYKEVSDSKGRFIANLWYWMQIVILIPTTIRNSTKWSFVMIRNYLKIFLRNIVKYKGYAFIHITGLTIGFTCFILIFLFIRYEFSYDRQHTNVGRIYKPIFKFTEQYSMGTPKRAHSHPLLAPTLLDEFPEIESATRFSKYNNAMVRVQDQKFLFDKWVWADPRIFEVFDLPFIYGDPETALKDPFTVVLDEQTALKLYGQTNIIGKTLHFIRGREESFKVTGVIKNLPRNSHFRPNLLGSYDTQNSLGLRRSLNYWGGHWFHSYLLLKKGCRAENLEAKIQSFIKQKIHPLSSSDNWTYTLQPLTDIHLKSTDILNNLEATGDIKYVTICSLIAFFILFIAGVNFVNLSTARSFTRFREVSIRKVVGANRLQLIKQFLGESMTFTFISIVTAIGLVLLILHGFAHFVDRDITAHSMTQPGFILSILLFILLVGMLSGCYPALTLSGFKPLAILKGSFLQTSKSIHLRGALVVFQFAISLFLIIGTLVISDQIKLIRTKKLGFDRERVVVVNLIDSPVIRNRDVVKGELLQNPMIQGVTFTQTLPTYINWGSEFDFEGRGDKKRVTFYYSQVDYDYLDVFGMEIAAGRNFSREMTTDVADGGAFLLNETAASQLGWEDPIGKKIGFPGSENPGTVVGIVKDFNSQSLRVPAPPVALILNTGGGNIYFLSIKIGPGNMVQTLNEIGKIWKKYSDGYPFNYTFLDQAYDNMYQSEMELNRIFRSFTFLAIFISSLGLFGLASFTAERRTKEIGIRKVLGASVPGIFVLLSRGFTKWVVLANIIAWPIAYYFMNKWLQNFAYRTSLSIWIFILSGLAALGIALLTVSYQTIKAAMSNPVEVLRYE